jgi:hypothetical protein
MKPTKKAALDKDLAKVGTALRRAAKQARKATERTHIPLVSYKQGRMMRKQVAKETSR